MTTTGATLAGGEALRKALLNLPTLVGWEQQREALKAGAEPIRAEAAMLCPRGSDESERMADHIVVHALSGSDADRDAEVTGNEAIVRIGPAKRFFYGTFLDTGTSHQDAQPFMRPAFDNNLHRSLQITADHLWQALQQGTQPGGGR